MKYLIATMILFASLFVGWFVSTKYLESVILRVFNPESHDKYLDIWFSMFVFIELAIIFVYVVYAYKLHKHNKHLTKSSSGR